MHNLTARNDVVDEMRQFGVKTRGHVLELNAVHLTQQFVRWTRLWRQRNVERLQKSIDRADTEVVVITTEMLRELPLILVEQHHVLIVVGINQWPRNMVQWATRNAKAFGDRARYRYSARIFTPRFSRLGEPLANVSEHASNTIGEPLFCPSGGEFSALHVVNPWLRGPFFSGVRRRRNKGSHAVGTFMWHFTHGMLRQRLLYESVYLRYIVSTDSIWKIQHCVGFAVQCKGLTP